MLVVLGIPALGLGLEQECTIDDDLLIGTQTRQHLDLITQVASAADAPDLEVTGVFRKKDAPLVAHALHGRHRHGEQRRVGRPDRQCPMTKRRFTNIMPA